jgi:hypothetical protein
MFRTPVLILWWFYYQNLQNSLGLVRSIENSQEENFEVQCTALHDHLESLLFVRAFILKSVLFSLRSL